MKGGRRGGVGGKGGRGGKRGWMRGGKREEGVDEGEGGQR